MFVRFCKRLHPKHTNNNKFRDLVGVFLCDCMLIQSYPSQKDKLSPSRSKQSQTDPHSTFQCRHTAEVLWLSKGNIWASTEVSPIISPERLMRIINNQLCACVCVCLMQVLSESCQTDRARAT